MFLPYFFSLPSGKEKFLFRFSACCPNLGRKNFPSVYCKEQEEEPGHAIFGEEGGLEAPSARSAELPEYLWVLDPIDGTKSFATGNPLFTTLIALVHMGKPTLGLIDAPALEERFLGFAKQGGRSEATLNGEAISVRPCEGLSHAFMHTTTPFMFPSQEQWQTYLQVANSVQAAVYGCDGYAYGLLSSGRTDLVVEADLKPYDVLAHVPVIEGAGGVITDWEGEEVGWWPEGLASGALNPVKTTTVIAAGDVRVHEAARKQIVTSP